ncbi:MAG: formyltetrahydrofolate deformylase [Myxococcales bacterium]|jgi:formyltetrahydrofolate deformylase|nr:formyltetrahydrofolate deformylase [Myxococcales bacterium]
MPPSLPPTTSDPRPRDLGTLLVSCADRRGLVAALAQILAGHGANLLDSDQHADPTAGQFFQRIRFDASELRTDRATLVRGIGEVAERFSMKWRLCWGDERKRVAIFVSRYDHCLIDLLARWHSRELDCDIPLIVSNHEALRPIADYFQIPFHMFPISPETKHAQEEAEAALLEAEGVDLIVLARYMQILSGSFIERFPERIINIHHSFLPAFKGGKPYQQAHARGVKLIGATAHYTTVNLDEGPIIEQDVVRCSHRDRATDLSRKGSDLEKVVLARAVRWHLEDRILVCGNKTVVFA